MQNFDLENIDCHAALAMIEKRWGFPRRTLQALLGMTKSGQSGRSLLPESGADAPAVLSAVYPDSTPAKNRQADVPQYGRSMIEMLGVLAIIGVLSVGGIAGYSKAMMKYRINKTIEQITLIAGNVRSFFASQRNYSGVDNTDVIKKAKLVPDEMWNGDHLETVFGSNFGIDSNNGTSFSMELEMIPEEACIELITQDWSNSNIKFIRVMNKSDNGGEYKLQLPVDIDVAVRACNGIFSADSHVDFLVNGKLDYWK